MSHYALAKKAYFSPFSLRGSCNAFMISRLLPDRMGVALRRLWHTEWMDDKVAIFNRLRRRGSYRRLPWNSGFLGESLRTAPG
jgi:hypothetical protein